MVPRCNTARLSLKAAHKLKCQVRLARDWCRGWECFSLQARQQPNLTKPYTYLMINRNHSARNGRACYSWSSRLYRPIYALASRYFPKRERSNYNSTQGTPEENLDRELDLSAKRRSLWSAGGLLAPWIYGLFLRRSIYTRVRSWPSISGQQDWINKKHTRGMKVHRANARGLPQSLFQEYKQNTFHASAFQARLTKYVRRTLD